MLLLLSVVTYLDLAQISHCNLQKDKRKPYLQVQMKTTITTSDNQKRKKQEQRRNGGTHGDSNLEIHTTLT